MKILACENHWANCRPENHSTSHLYTWCYVDISFHWNSYCCVFWALSNFSAIFFPVYLALPSIPIIFIGHAHRATNETKMSSSLLLGNFTTLQEQHQSTQILSTNPLMSPTLAFRLYDTEFDHNMCDPLAKSHTPTDTKRPSAIATATTIPTTSAVAAAAAAVAIASPSKFKKCTCCPYGYHIDLDFIRYCEELAKNGKQPTNKQLERRNKRRQRKSLEVMLGFNDQWLFDLGKQPAIVTNKPQPSPFQTVYEVFYTECRWLHCRYEFSTSVNELCEFCLSFVYSWSIIQIEIE